MSHPEAVDALALLAGRGQTLATAESLTGGLLAGEITAVPGASTVFVGSVVSYATRIKSDVLGVDPDLLRRHGAVDPEVARQMARGVSAVLGADYAVATTGSAGPDPAPGGSAGPDVAPGIAFIAVAGPRETSVRSLNLTGDRAAIRRAVVEEALGLLLEMLREDAP